jgi:hypothetical protein
MRNAERDQRRELAALAEQHGCSAEFEYTHKGHIRAIFRAGTKRAAMVMAKGHGGDTHGRMNNITRVRRQLREITGSEA